MTTVYDVPPELLIKKVAEDLKTTAIKPPNWALYVKTGVHKERAPLERDWWYLRLAAVFRKIYIESPVGVSRLSAEFGGKVDDGSAPYHAKKGSRSIVRHCLAQLEALGYVKRANNKGRELTPKGRAYLDNTAHRLLLEIIKTKPELKKYL